MMRFTIIGIFVLLTVGCGRASVFSSGSLPVYGTDPLMHTIYMGTDESYHHFALQHGKSGGVALVPIAVAQIKPEPFVLNSGREAFVKSAKPGEIELIVLRSDR